MMGVWGGGKEGTGVLISLPGFVPLFELAYAPSGQRLYHHKYSAWNYFDYRI